MLPIDLLLEWSLSRHSVGFPALSWFLQREGPALLLFRGTVKDDLRLWTRRACAAVVGFLQCALCTSWNLTALSE